MLLQFPAETERTSLGPAKAPPAKYAMVERTQTSTDKLIELRDALGKAGTMRKMDNRAREDLVAQARRLIEQAALLYGE